VLYRQGTRTSHFMLKIDLVTRPAEGGCKLILVEVGPWNDEEKQQNLQRLGQRISDCVTAALNGMVAQRYPTTMGEPITIQVDSYDTPRLDVDILVARLQNAFNASEEIQQQLRMARFTPAIRVTHHWADFATELAKREAARKGGLWQRLRAWGGKIIR
jgi:hypothetical protein